MSAVRIAALKARADTLRDIYAKDEDDEELMGILEEAEEAAESFMDAVNRANDRLSELGEEDDEADDEDEDEDAA